jgi:hypothetical protein
MSSIVLCPEQWHGTFYFLACWIDMNDTERKASKAMIRYVLMIFVIAIIIAVAYLALFTPGKAETVSPVMRGGPDAILYLRGPH